MRAVRYHGPRQPLQLEDIPRPTPGPGEVLVRVTAAGVCHTELHFLSGLLDLGVAPLTLGHEIVGRIEQVGEGIDAARLGERVLVYYYVGCGTCDILPPRRREPLRPTRAEYGFFHDGGSRSSSSHPSRNALALPDSLSDHAAAPIGCGVTTALHATNLASVRLGDWVVVYGIGGVGFGLVQVARLSGARVIAVGRSPAKLDQARALGAEHVIRAGDEDVAARVRALTNGHGADVVFELVATRETMAQARRRSRSGAGSCSSATRRTRCKFTQSSS